MALGDGVRRNIASVDPAERAMLRDAFVELNKRKYPGSRDDRQATVVDDDGVIHKVPGGVSWWFKQDEIHQATHVHEGPEFLPWHRVMVNRMEELIRQINPQLSLHYWDWTQDPRAIPGANLGGGSTGTLNLFDPEDVFMGYGGETQADIGAPWLKARYYVPGASPHRDVVPPNPFDPPRSVKRSVGGPVGGVPGNPPTRPATGRQDQAILDADDYKKMRGLLEPLHDAMHGFVNMGGAHISFRDPFVFLLHSNVDRLFARWQTDPEHLERLSPTTVYGPETDLDVPVHAVVQNVKNNVEPWSTGHSVDEFGHDHFTRPWYGHEPGGEGEPFTYKDPSVVYPPAYDTNEFTLNLDFGAFYFMARAGMLELLLLD